MKRVCIIDDEVLSRERIKRLLVQRDNFEVVGEADNGWDAVSIINETRPDLILLDIRMAALSGFDVLEKIDVKPAVIFITAYDEHAVEAFKVHALDYLLKPFHDERFFEALDRLEDRGSTDFDVLSNLESMLKGEPAKTVLKKITVKDKFDYKVIDIKNIDFFGTEGGLVFLYTNGHRFIVDQTLSKLEESLPGDVFFRAHRKSLVNINRIERVAPWGRGRYVLVFQGDERVRVSKEKTAHFKALVGML